MVALLVASLPLCARPLAGQNILNVEQLQPREVQGVHFGAQISAALSAGNTEIVDIGATGSAGYQSPTHWIRVLAGIEFLSEEGDEIDDNRFAHVRYNYTLARRLKTFHFVQIQTARNLLLQRRLVIGSGLRARAVADSTLRLDLGTGLMFEDERLDDVALQPAPADKVDTFRLANLAALTLALRPGLELTNVTYFQPSLAAPSDFRILEDLILVVQISARLSLNVALRWRHDSRPPVSVERDDVKLTTGLSLDYP